MRGDYGSLVWVNDREGHEYVCTVESEHLRERELENLTPSERESCQDVNTIVGTERW